MTILAHCDHLHDNVTMAAGSHAGSDYGSDIEEDEDLSELLHDVEFQHASQQRLRFLEQNAEASVVPTLAAMPSVLVDHDMDEYGWRDGEVEVLEDDAGILISPMEVGDQKDEDRCERRCQCALLRHRAD